MTFINGIQSCLTFHVVVCVQQECPMSNVGMPFVFLIEVIPSYEFLFLNQVLE